MISEAAWFLCEVLLLEDALVYVYMGAKVNRLLFRKFRLQPTDSRERNISLVAAFGGESSIVLTL